MGLGYTVVRITNRSAYPGAVGNANGSTTALMQTQPRSLVPVYRKAMASQNYARRTIGTYERWLGSFPRQGDAPDPSAESKITASPGSCRWLGTGARSGSPGAGVHISHAQVDLAVGVSTGHALAEPRHR
jgi:hypothetical protein